MAAFNRYINNCSKIDWSILINGSISLYYDEDILEKDLEWLKSNQYENKILDFNTIDSIELFHNRIKEICDFPEYYGENMSALSDCMLYDLNIPYEGGIALVFKNFNLFYEKDKTMAHEILERVSEASRRRILTGERLITLLQSNDPLFSINSIGAYQVPWNRKEFAVKQRIKN